MNIFEFLKINGLKDEYGNYFFYYGSEEMDIPELYVNAYDECCFFTKEEFEKINSVKILLNQYYSEANLSRSPYYRLRGTPITEEQALDIIKRCDIGCKEFIEEGEYIGSCHFRCSLEYAHTWCALDGRIGINATTYKYPTMEELIKELWRYLYYFPYLNFIVAMTYDEGYLWENERATSDTIEEDFYDIIQYGFWIHENCIEMLDREETIEKYKDFEECCCFPAKMYYFKYYWNKEMYRASEKYAKKCLETCKEVDVKKFMKEYEKNKVK